MNAAVVTALKNARECKEHITQIYEITLNPGARKGHLMGWRRNEHSAKRGFTLIELSIALVIVGLLIGAALTGQDLIRAAGVRATISQIHRYNTAANTFREKYGYLPGDIKDPEASRFGFAARGGARGQGDGNGIMEGLAASYCGACYGVGFWGGEIPMFWVDLTVAHLIDDTFNTASSTANINNLTTTPSALFPQGKIGQSNYVLIQSFGSLSGTWQSTGRNFFTLQVMTAKWSAAPGLTVQQAYNIDKKIDDGLPLNGKVGSAYYNPAVYYLSYIGAAALPNFGGTIGFATPGTTNTCYDNGNNGANTMVYSVEISNGTNVNCALSFEFQ